jgi:tryptophan synthase alpha chain
MTGLKHISRTFAALKAQGRAALMPYFTLGFPTLEKSLDVVESLSRCGADLIELGVPFSDPLADGPTIQHSTQKALEQGMTAARCLEAAAQLRDRGIEQPLLLMGYTNPILAFGIERYAARAAAAGVDGLIVPDLPLEESSLLDSACRDRGLALVYLVSPASPPERVAALAARTTGFLYLVSLTGVTGARSHLTSGRVAFVGRVRPGARTPLAVGFGISTPVQARAVANLADGVIIGSALVAAAAGGNDPARAAGEFLSAIRAALDSPADHED